jgi:hypothetical protein
MANKTLTRSFVVALGQPERIACGSFPGNFNRLDYPMAPERVTAEVKARFEAWGGRAPRRLFGGR